MGEVISFSDYIDKKQTKKQYLAYEKGKVLEGVIESFIEEIPDVPEEKVISYFTKIVKKQIPIFEDTYFDSKYLWNANYLKYKLHTIKVVLRIHMLLNQEKEELITSLSFLTHLTLFFNENVKTFKKIIPYKYEELGLKFFERSIEYKKKIESWKPRPIGPFPEF